MGPSVTDRKGDLRDLFEQLHKDGFVRVSDDGEILRLDELKALKKQDKYHANVHLKITHPKQLL
eukprot:COSAG01_NODE_65242_length_274_cov_0.462857_1_plen_64_part_00